MYLRNGLLQNRLIYKNSITFLYLPITIIFVVRKTGILILQKCGQEFRSGIVFIDALFKTATNKTDKYILGF
jgi:hypothetical protein